MLVTSATVPGQVSRAGTTSIDVEHSTITVYVYRSGLFSFAGDNHEVRAPIKAGIVDESQRKVEIEVEVRALRVSDPHLSSEKRSQVQQKMLSPDVLDPERFPIIKFVSNRVEPKRDKELLVHGTLTLHGEMRPIVVLVSGTQPRYRGSATLKQTAFGIQPVSIAGGTVKVKDEVKIDFDVITH